VVQLYTGPIGASYDGTLPDRPQQWLAGFANVEAHPGESITVRIPLPERTFQVWDEGWHTVPGTYAVTAAHALDDPRLTTEVTL
jgi:beta-glucosidase